MIPNTTRSRKWLIFTGAAAAWATFIAYCAARDTAATQLAIILPPIFGTALLLAARLRSVPLTLFMGLTFVSHAIAPPFFFMKKEVYSYGGNFAAVKAFGFGVGEFMEMYGLVIFFTFAMLGFAAIGLKIVRRTVQWPGLQRYQRGQKPVRRALYDFAIVLFILVIALPQTFLMYELRVGITGLISPVLPLRLTGLLYYSRMFIYPLFLFIAYSRSKRSLPTALVILGYACTAALTSSSRYVLLASGISVVMFAIVDRRRVRLLAAMLVLMGGFLVTSNSRNYIYSEKLPFPTYVALSIKYEGSSTSFADVVGAIALRLWGPQDIVLAYQHDVPSRATAIVRWFTDRVVVEDLTYQFYGMVFEPGSGFGVGIGVIPWMIVLARRSYIVLLFLAGVIALLMILSDIAVLGVRATNRFNASAAADPLAFLLVYVLYSATIRWFYQLLIVAFLGIWLLRIAEKLLRPPRRRSQEESLQSA